MLWRGLKPHGRSAAELVYLRPELFTGTRAWNLSSLKPGVLQNPLGRPVRAVDPRSLHADTFPLSSL